LAVVLNKLKQLNINGANTL